MRQPVSSGEFPELSQANVEAWEAIASWWDEVTGEADMFHRQVVIPAMDRLLGLRPQERILDVGCGNGAYSRQLAGQGAEVVGVDASLRLIECARQRTPAEERRITYHHLDCGDAIALRTLGTHRFDAAVCKMVLMDMAVIEPLLRALRDVLKPGGRFIFSVVHPAFNSTGMHLQVEQTTNEAGFLEEVRSVKVIRYLQPEAKRGVAKRDQLHPQYYFHRPLHVLFNACFQVGFVLDGLEEPPTEMEVQGTKELSWARFKEIPPVLVARMRLSATENATGVSNADLS